MNAYITETDEYLVEGRLAALFSGQVNLDLVEIDHYLVERRLAALFCCWVNTELVEIDHYLVQGHLIENDHYLVEGQPAALFSCQVNTLRLILTLLRNNRQLCLGVKGGLQGLADLAEVGCLPLELHEALKQRQLAGQQAPFQHLT